MLFPQTYINELRNKIDKANNILLVSHFNPDGDTIGAACAMYNYLKSKNKNTEILIPNEYPSFLDFIMIDIPYIIASKRFNDAKAAIEQTDLIICLDFNAFHRAGDFLKDILITSPKQKILIDHHLEPEIHNFDLVFSKINVSSTSELLYEVLQLMEEKPFLTKEIAQGIYVGICTDTGSFSFSCNNRRTYEIVAELVDYGVDVEYVHQEVYNTYSENRLRLLGFCLSERLTVFHKEKAALIYLSKEDLKRFNYQIGDCEGVVNFCLTMKGIEFGALVTERMDRIRISLRSKHDFDVNKFARKYWNGGGHQKAAGGHSFESLDWVLENLTKQIKNTCN
ncbi:MAG: bifunctional oligoribonuclease/PAP phosphatase NrnA [Bacteroidales bacterium]|jgi:phosphoesterase RecJ-like protein|nr:bifunctional oligoribonuclease/PAP phosphatase NrnA [Bacteroidales bacterium]MDD4703498.1 bifunctional oligoribonuclease/PAP phosphatase NrnA [Bacteroidales bacterium]MDX9798813.1 bifunctional oligoribonuclease/PAP phosphatase NrnA [Bacteroidales bacterium]